MRLRDFQVYAPDQPREINVQLSVITELVVHWLRQRPLAVGPIAKLLISLYPTPLSWRGPEWVIWPDHIGELRVTDARVLSAAETKAAGTDAVVRGVKRATDMGIDVDADGMVRELLPAMGQAGPYEVELPKLAFRDPTTKAQHTVWYTFSVDAARIEIRPQAGGVVPVVSSDAFVSQYLLFPATKSRVLDGAVRFLSASGVEIASSVIARPGQVLPTS